MKGRAALFVLVVGSVILLAAIALRFQGLEGRSVDVLNLLISNETGSTINELSVSSGVRTCSITNIESGHEVVVPIVLSNTHAGSMREVVFHIDRGHEVEAGSRSVVYLDSNAPAGERLNLIVDERGNVKFAR